LYVALTALYHGGGSSPARCPCPLEEEIDIFRMDTQGTQTQGTQPGVLDSAERRVFAGAGRQGWLLLLLPFHLLLWRLTHTAY
jgi:hypothetical protein